MTSTATTTTDTATVWSPLAELEAGVAGLAQTAGTALAGGVGDLGPDEVVAVLQRLETCRNRLQTVDTALIGRVEQTGVPDRLATRTLPGTIATICHLTRAEAAGRVRLAQATRPRSTMTGAPLAPDRPVLAERVAAGRVGPRQAQVVLEATRALDGLPHVDPGKIGWAERELCDLARILGPEDLAKVATKIRDVFDPDGTIPPEVQRARRYLALTVRGDEYRLSGTLTAAAGARLQACQDELAAPRPDDPTGRDTRTPGQRRHDALDAITGYILNHLPTRTSDSDGTETGSADRAGTGCGTNDGEGRGGGGADGDDSLDEDGPNEDGGACAGCRPGTQPGGNPEHSSQNRPARIPTPPASATTRTTPPAAHRPGRRTR